jgi:dTDP-4-dehydrorhamnose reductase
MKILVTGSSGLIGTTLCDYLKSRGEDIDVLNRDLFSWSDHGNNIERLSDYDCIVHTAASTNVEACEQDPPNCYRDNTLLTERLAYAASQAGCKFVYVSSTGIYGTEKEHEPYTEYDMVNPTTHHHRAKWLGEKAVNQFVKNALIVRAGWIFGGIPNNPKNFVARRIEEALNARTKPLRSNSQQRGVPTFVGDFVAKLYELLKNNEVGTFNLVNQGFASRFDYVSKIIELSNLDVEVLPISADSFNRKAKVSNNETAITLKLVQLGYTPLPPWTESLGMYIQSDLSQWIRGKQLNEKN